MNCNHTKRHCINPYDLIRKYRCEECGGVMMCACDEEIGRRFLPHQLTWCTDYETREEVAVSLGFQGDICAECRGLPAESFPLGEIHGRTSKIKRYYWREIHFEEMRRMGDWDEHHPDVSDQVRQSAHKAIEVEVLDAIKALHASSPKYNFDEPSQADILVKYSVEVISLKAKYAQIAQRGANILCCGETISAEAYVTRIYEDQGWTVLPLESRPFHALFGVMMWMLIQDPGDPKNRMVGFGDRAIYELGKSPPVIWTFLPEDFGSAAYGSRRESAIFDHLKRLLPDRDELLWVFDYWRTPSTDFRQYLWAHLEADVDRARRLIEILEPDTILFILQYLVDSYWERYLGWPDLLLNRHHEHLFLEVKSSADRLSQDQKRWIADNHDFLRLPFKLVKIHRANSKKHSTAHPSA